MKISWLGQAGFRLVTDNGTVIMIDPPIFPIRSDIKR